jgi:predicted esterase
MTDPHAGQPVVTAGAPLAEAGGAVVLLHGRGDSARGILGLAEALDRPDLAWLAPQAAGGAWYPHSFLAPIEANEPQLSSAVRAVLRAVEQAETAGIDRPHVVLGGFSQGACLACEVAARHAGRWGGLFALSGGLIGTGPGPADAPRLHGMGGTYADKAFDYAGSLAGVPAFLGCSDRDPHIPLPRVERTADVLRQLGADPDLRVYPDFGHAVNADEVEAVRGLLARAAPAGP